MTPVGKSDRAAGRPGVFLDRDGTVIEHVHYLSDPSKVRLLPGAAEALKRLRGAGYVCVVVTNQSGLGRGLFTEDRLREVHDAMDRRLTAEGAAVDATYWCPVPPVGSDPTVIEYEDRKPGPGMLVRASRELGLDLAASWMVGDMVSDVLAGVHAGCLGSILVLTGKGGDEAGLYPGVGRQTADDLLAASDLILAHSRPGV